ncbi:MAG: 2Fe-2S iron-sulfur cluster-binding protein [Bacillota bacterium]
MVKFILNGLTAAAAKGATLLETARFYGIDIPTLCHYDGLNPSGACRLCLVEVGTPGRSRLVSSCTYPVGEGLNVRTHSRRVIKTRQVLLELYLATCPSSKTIQDLASKHHVTTVRFRAKHEECILCGLCTRYCADQMQGRAIGLVNRGAERRVAGPFNKKSEECRLCGGCMFICPVCQARCQGPQEKNPLCSACLNLAPACLDRYHEAMCYLDPCVACELEK